MKTPAAPSNQHQERPAAELRPLSHDVLVQVRLAVVGRSEGAEPGYREGVSEHHLHVHPLGPLGPASLLLLQLFDALRRRRREEG